MDDDNIKTEYEPDIGPSDMMYEIVDVSTPKNIPIWTSTETKELFDLYRNFINEVGPRKRFKRKMDMWVEISAHIPQKSSRQCQDRVKTVLRRKKKGMGRIYVSESKVKASDFEPEEFGYRNSLEIFRKNKHKSDFANGKIWSNSETQLLIDLYNRLINEVGYQKQIAHKKAMWLEISKHIPGKNSKQCEERFRTVLRKKIKGLKKTDILDIKRNAKDFEDFESIQNSVKSIKKNKLRDSQSETELNCTTKFEESNSSDSDTNDPIGEDINDHEELDTEIGVTITPEISILNDVNDEINDPYGLYKILMAITAKKEEAKERRHKEKMDAIQDMKDFFLQLFNK